MAQEKTNTQRYLEKYGRFPMIVDFSEEEVPLEARIAKAPTGETYKLLSKFCSRRGTIVWSHFVEYPGGHRGKVKIGVCESGPEYLEAIRIIEKAIERVTHMKLVLQRVNRAFFDLQGKFIGADA